MSSLLDDTIETHGGLARWSEIKEVSVDVLATGALFERKGFPPSGKPTNVRVRAHSPYVERRPFPNPDQYGVFEPDRVAIMTNDGAVVGERTQPRDSFAGHTSTTPWDVFHLIYFGGYANWEYLTTPFSFRMPGFHIEELSPWEEDGETWRRLKVLFPPDVPTHSTKQVFYFDRDLLLRRQDYNTRDIGGGDAANYAFDYTSFDGIKLPMKRRVYPRGADNKPNTSIMGVALDFSSPMPSESTLTVRAFSVKRVTITSAHTFEAVQGRLEHLVPKLDYGIFDLVKRGELDQALDRLRAAAPLSIFGVRDHGALLMIAGLHRRALQYEIGNVLTATLITREQLSAAVYPPPRVLLREDDEGVVAFEYDRPASLFGQFGDDRVDRVAGELDATLQVTLQAAAS